MVLERTYHRSLPIWGELYKVTDFLNMMREGAVTNQTGHGYWVKDGRTSDDEVFTTFPGDATHVIWFKQ